MRKNLGNILWGLVFIGIGIGLTGNIFDLWDYKVFFDGWWTLFIIVPAFISIIQSGFRFSNLIMLGIGSLLLLDRQQIIPEGMIFKFAPPAVFIIIGIIIITKIIPGNKNSDPLQKVSSSSEDYPDYFALFSGNSIKNNSTDFKGGSSTAIFGGNEIDLSDVVLNRDVTFTVTSIFGGNDIKAPTKAKIEMRGVPIFGGNENSARSSEDENASKITFVCTSIFGGTEIK